jgi:hypothetical protein
VDACSDDFRESGPPSVAIPGALFGSIGPSLVSSRQDAALEAVIGAVFGQSVALFVPAVVAVKAAISVGWIEAVISALGLCAESWLLKSWRFSLPS